MAKVKQKHKVSLKLSHLFPVILMIYSSMKCAYALRADGLACTMGLVFTIDPTHQSNNLDPTQDQKCQLTSRLLIKI